VDERLLMLQGESVVVSHDRLPVRVYARADWPLEIRYTDQPLDPAALWEDVGSVVTIVVPLLSRAERLERCLADLRMLLSEERP
jgi:hypothetical protein